MKSKSFLFFFLLILASLQLGMARQGQYDEEARQIEREEKARLKAEKRSRQNPAKNFAQGVKEVAYDSPAGLLSDTTASTLSRTPVVGTLEGAQEGTGKVLDNTVRGASKIATLGIGGVSSYEIEEPEQGSTNTTKIKIKIPGT